MCLLILYNVVFDCREVVSDKAYILIKTVGSAEKPGCPYCITFYTHARTCSECRGSSLHADSLLWVVVGIAIDSLIKLHWWSSLIGVPYSGVRSQALRRSFSSLLGGQGPSFLPPQAPRSVRMRALRRLDESSRPCAWISHATGIVSSEGSLLIDHSSTSKGEQIWTN